MVTRVCTKHTHLVNGTGDQTLNVFPVSKNLWESRAKSWSGLHRRETNLPNVVGVLKSKDSLSLVGCHTFMNPENLSVEVWLRAKIQ